MSLIARLRLLLLSKAPLILFGVIVLTFGAISDRFLAFANFRNILIQAAPLGILAIGMTFVLLIAQIDLSVGAVMYSTACLLALDLPGLPWPLGLGAVAIAAGLVGLVNGLIVTRIGVASFVTTLAMLFIVRGAAMWMSQTRTLPFPDAITDLNRSTILGVPAAIVAFGVVFGLAWVVLRDTPFGRQIYAVGDDPEAARKAGIPVERVTVACFVISAVLAGVGGFLTVTQIGAVGPKYGDQMEFAAIAAAVLGGVSLFGGRGSVSGTLFGATLVKTTQNGLNIINANPYVYPLVTAGIIFLAVAVDGVSTRALDRLRRRSVRPLER